MGWQICTWRNWWAIVIALACSPAVSGAPVTLVVENVEAQPSAEFEVVIATKDGQGLGGLQFQLHYDPAVIEWGSATLHENAGGGLLDAKVIQPGHVRIALASQDAVNEDGPLINATFTAVGEGSSSSDVSLTDARAWTHDEIHEMHVETQSGTVSMAATALPIPMYMIAIAGGAVLLVVIVVALRRGKG